MLNQVKVEARFNNQNNLKGFINHLIYKRKIKLWNLQTNGETTNFNISPCDYKQVAQAAAIYYGKTKVSGRQGIYFLLRRFRERYGIIFGIVGFAFINLVLSAFIWDIRVSGNEALTEGQIKEHLSTLGIVAGLSTRELDKAAAELSLLAEFDRLSWVSVERRGSRLNIKVAEREETSSSLSREIACNVIAERPGRIVETEVYRGELMRTLGSGVAKGELIVSGTVDDGAGNILFLHADAKIIAECEETVSFFAPYSSTEKKKTGRVITKDYLYFLGNDFPLFLSRDIPENANYSEQLKQPTILGIKAPFRIRSAIYTEYEQIEVIELTDGVLKNLKTQIDTYEKNFYGDGYEIVKWHTEYTPTQTGIGAELSVVYRTNIAQKSQIRRKVEG